MNDNPNVVIYELNVDNPQLVNEFITWKEVEPFLKEFFPYQLQKYTTKNSVTANNVYIPLIEKLDVSFILSTDKRVSVSRYWSELDKHPFFHICFVYGNNLDNYKTTIRNELKKWTTEMNDKNNEYLIVCVPPSGEKNTSTLSLFSGKFKLYDRIKNDFGKKNDRVVKIQVDKKLKEEFTDLVSKIVDAILLEFGNRCKLYQDKIKEEEGHHTLPGWQYCNYFYLKEGLALTLEKFGLHFQSLCIYDELESFKERQNIEFKTFGDLKLVNILDPESKSYRDMKHNSSINEFDFKCYLFGRRMNLYFKMKSLITAAELALKFIPNMERYLKQCDEVSRSFTHSWAYTTTMNVIDACKKRAFDINDEQILHHLCKLMGDLYVYSRFELLMLCKQFGLVPSWKRQCTATVPNEDVYGTLAGMNQQGLDKMYLELSNAAANLYNNGKRPRFVQALNAEIAYMRLHKEEVPEVQNLLEANIKMYKKDKWNVLSNLAYVNLANTYLKLNDYENYLITVINILSNPIEDEKKIFYKNEILKYKDIKIKLDANKLFEIDLDKDTNIERGNLTNFKFILKSNLIGELKIDSIKLYFKEKTIEKTDSESTFDESSISDDFDSISLQKDNITIKGGSNEIICEHVFDKFGDFIFTSAIIFIGKIQLKINQSKEEYELHITDPQFNISLFFPDLDHLIINEQQDLKIQIIPENVIISHGTLHLKSNHIKFLSCNDGIIQLQNISKKHEMGIPIKCSEPQDTIFAELEYFTQNEDCLKISQSVELKLYHPFTYNVSENVIDNMTFVQLTISSQLLTDINLLKYEIGNELEDLNKNVTMDKLYPKEEIMYLFRRQAHSNIETSFILYYEIPTTKRRNTFSIPIHLKPVPKVTHEIHISLPEQPLTIGSVYPFKFSIKSLDESNSPLLYEVEVNEESWMIAGHIKQSVQLSKDEEKHYSCLISPLQCGYLSIPTIKVHGDCNVRLVFECNRIMVINNDTVIGLCKSYK